MLFSDIPGNETVKSALIRMADSGRIPHAMLFYENDGCGALALALAFYQYLCCEKRTPDDSCAQCPECNKVSKLIHPDLHFVFPSDTGAKGLAAWRELVLSNPFFIEQEFYRALGVEKRSGIINVAQAKEIVEKLSLTAVEDGFKAVIVWLPEKMNAECANKLLKVMEEPPEQTLFMLVTHAPEKMLQTIFSRCQSMRVLPVTKEEVARVLQAQFSIPEDVAREQAALACGSVGEALAAMGDNEERSRWTHILSDLFRASLAGNLETALEAGESMAALETREKQKGFCTFAAEFIRKLFIAGQGLADLAGIRQGEMDLVREAAPHCSERFCRMAAAGLDRAAMLIERNVNARIVFCDLVNRIFISLQHERR